MQRQTDGSQLGSYLVDFDYFEKLHQKLHEFVSRKSHHQSWQQVKQQHQK